MHETPAVDNDLYRRRGHAWWDDEAGEFSTLRFFVNPVRFAYFVRTLDALGAGEFRSLRLLDVGCGGGFLSEEFARAGFQVTGIDPAPETVAAAQAHAHACGLPIDYRTGSGEHLPFEDRSFDLAACCDVLEHVGDPGRVFAEIARVLKPGGVFFYDTVNRTFMSWLAVIKVMQEWPATAFAPPNAHVWRRFITPRELHAHLGRCGLVAGGTRGISASANPLAVWLALRRRAQGRISFKELGERLGFRESGDLGVSYMGYATAPR